MNKKILQYIIFLSIWPCTLQAQQKVLNIANKQFEEKQYISAQQTYLKVLKTSYKSPEVLKKLGDSYYYNSQLEEAEQWYRELIELYPEELTNDYVYKYAQCVKSLENYDLAEQYLTQYHQNSENGSLNNAFPKEDYLKKIEYQSGRYQIENQEINSTFTDFGTSKYGDMIVFTSSRDTLLVRKRIHKWTDESFLALYQAKIDPETKNLYEVEPFAKELNSKFHESTPVFTQDGNTIYFTKNKLGTTKDELDILGIYMSTKNELGEWSIPVSLSINEQEYSVAHPALSPDEKTLYFSSDKPGGYGDSDLYEVSIDEDGQFGTPYNMGSEINTEGKDTFPFISQSGEFYFTSNGHYGLGGLDIFYADFDETEDKIEIINIGTPVNSNKDDFSFYIDSDTREGYFSSNRAGGVGKDDLYRLAESAPIRSVKISIIMGTVIDKSTREALPGTLVTVYDRENRIIEQQIIQTESADFQFSSKALKNAYSIRAEKEGYETFEHIIENDRYTNIYLKKIELEQDLEPIINTIAEEKPGDFASSEDAFDFELIANSSHFLDDSATMAIPSIDKLNEIAGHLKKYPKVRVSIESYIDEDPNNTNLAQQRANTIRDFLLSQGVPSEQMRAIGVPKGSVKQEEILQLIMVVPLPIHFDFNSSDLRQNSNTGLDKVAKLMNLYPTMFMEVHGHTDSRSSFWYNKKLSVERMRSALNYLTSIGKINWRRMRGKAYGERKLFNQCSDGVDCSEEQHEKNRRCEFIIKK